MLDHVIWEYFRSKNVKCLEWREKDPGNCSAPLLYLSVFFFFNLNNLKNLKIN